MQKLITKPCDVYAGFFVRLAAYFIDWLVAGCGVLILSIPIWIINLIVSDNIFNYKILFEFTVWNIVTYLLYAAYRVLLTYYAGATVGKKLMKLKVISVDQEKLSFTDVLYRETIGRYLCSVAMNVGYLLVGVDAQKRGFHDMLSDTRVVYDLEKKKKVVRTMGTPDYMTKPAENMEMMTQENFPAESDVQQIPAIDEPTMIESSFEQNEE